MIERDAQANGASIRNFGFVTVTGQQRGECWRRAMRSRDIWAEVAPAAGIRVEHRGLAVAVRRPEAVAVLEAFRATEMGAGCELLLGRRGGAALPDAGRRRPARGARGARTSCGSNRAARSPPWPAGWPRRTASRSSARRSSTPVAPPTIETTRGTLRGRALRRLPGRRFPGPVRRALRRLRPDPLQAAHAAGGAVDRAAPLQRGGHVRSRPGPLPGLCRAAGGRGAASGGSRPSSPSISPTAST